MKPTTGAKNKAADFTSSHSVLQKYKKTPLSPVGICRGVFVCDKLAFTGISSRQSRFGPRGSVPLSDGLLPAGAAALDALQKPLQSMGNTSSMSQLPWVRQRLCSSRALNCANPEPLLCLAPGCGGGPSCSSLLSPGTRPASAASFGAANPSEVLTKAFCKGVRGVVYCP